MGIWLFFYPLSNSSEHVSMNFEVFVAESRMVEDVKNILHDFINWNARILPGIENTSVVVRIYCEKKVGRTYGVTYCKIVVATRPATPFNLFEK